MYENSAVMVDSVSQSYPSYERMFSYLIRW